MIAVNMAKEAGQWGTAIGMLSEIVDCDAVRALWVRGAEEQLAGGAGAMWSVWRHQRRRRTADVRELRHDAIESRHGKTRSSIRLASKRILILATRRFSALTIQFRGC